MYPLSTDDKPKQFHDVSGSGRSLLQETVLLAEQISDIKKISVIGNRLHKFHLIDQLGQIHFSLLNNILLEEEARNTAASIFLACQTFGKGVVMILPCDQKISGDFKKSVLKALRLVQKGKIVTFGIEPSAAKSDYGYICENSFHEKPDPYTAQNLIDKGALWNSGIFIFDVETMLAEYKKFHPEFFEFSFHQYPKLPFDKAIMEKTDKLAMVKAGFDWQDLGNWQAVRENSCNQELIDFPCAENLYLAS